MKTALVLALTILIAPMAFAGDKDSVEANPAAYADSQVVLQTALGDIVLDLYPDVAPQHVLSLTKLVNMGFYDSLIFHRVIKETLIQGGCPKGDGTGEGPWKVPAELSDLQHVDGTLGMARKIALNSATSQFYICLRPMPFLDGKYTVFGHVADSSSLAVAHKIGMMETTGKVKPPAKPDFPLDPAYIERAYVRGKPAAK
ncbi:MAG: peptidylprolyl isomerase [candidate division Zixibacteria bacterium]|nr:peptidylprolyl isomerase [candidate division Zixibacteria bacterium]MBU1470542.1 peptidylprolyl isomerase [candidate division Zixibacteria bacterium]